jgi:ATP-dependent RNA helicase DeaD
MRDPKRLGLSAGMEASTTLTHSFYEVSKDSKYEALVNLLHIEQPELAILFCHTKAETEELARKLSVEGFKAAFLNGDLPQALRTKTLDAFRCRQTTLLVATDVAARGIDVKGISHIINFGVPRDVETYIHRSGRAGRMGKEGRAMTLVIPADRIKMRHIVKDAKLPAEMKAVPQADEVRRRMRERFFEDLMLRVDADDFGEMKQFAEDLIGNLNPVGVVAALLQDGQLSSGILAAGYDVEIPKAKHSQRPEKPFREGSKKSRQRPEKSPKEEGMTRLRINLGKGDRVNPGYLVRIICDQAEINSKGIGAISLFPHHALVDVKSNIASQVVEAMNASVDDRGRQWSVGYSD